jgi:hypothetical protein
VTAASAGRSWRPRSPARMRLPAQASSSASATPSPAQDGTLQAGRRLDTARGSYPRGTASWSSSAKSPGAGRWAKRSSPGKPFDRQALTRPDHRHIPAPLRLPLGWGACWEAVHADDPRVAAGAPGAGRAGLDGGQGVGWPDVSLVRSHSTPRWGRGRLTLPGDGISAGPARPAMSRAQIRAGKGGSAPCSMRLALVGAWRPAGGGQPVQPMIEPSGSQLSGSLPVGDECVSVTVASVPSSKIPPPPPTARLPVILVLDASRDPWL